MYTSYNFKQIKQICRGASARRKENYLIHKKKLMMMGFQIFQHIIWAYFIFRYITLLLITSLNYLFCKFKKTIQITTVPLLRKFAIPICGGYVYSIIWSKLETKLNFFMRTSRDLSMWSTISPVTLVELPPLIPVTTKINNMSLFP